MISQYCLSPNCKEKSHDVYTRHRSLWHGLFMTCIHVTGRQGLRYYLLFKPTGNSGTRFSTQMRSLPDFFEQFGRDVRCGTGEVLDICMLIFDQAAVDVG